MTRHEAIVIGASAGALEALSTVLSPLSKGFSLPIMVVVHLPPDKKSILAEVLQSKCRIFVQEAEDKEELKGGKVYIAPPDYHLLAEKNGSLSLSSEEPVLFSRPSIDVLFETAADAYRDRLIGVILTGANNDGAAGLRMISELGGTVLIQRPDLAYASPMPEAALHACPEAKVMSLDDISIFLQQAGTAL